MSPSGTILSRSAKHDERASDRTARPIVRIVDNSHAPELAPVKPKREPRPKREVTHLDIARLENLLRDLRTGMINLRDLRPRPHDLDRRVLAQAGKIRSVEVKLFSLRQGRLL